MNTIENVLTSTYKKELKNSLGEFGFQFCDYSGHHYIGDVISEIADSNIDIYFYDLFKWLPDNYSYVEEVIENGLVDTSNADIPKMIQAGQYEYNTQNLYKNLDSIMLYYCLDYIESVLNIEELTDSQYEKLENKCTNVDNNDTLEDFEEFCDELFNQNED